VVMQLSASWQLTHCIQYGQGMVTAAALSCGHTCNCDDDRLQTLYKIAGLFSTFIHIMLSSLFDVIESCIVCFKWCYFSFLSVAHLSAGSAYCLWVPHAGSRRHLYCWCQFALNFVLCCPSFLAVFPIVRKHSLHFAKFSDKINITVR